MRFYLHAKYFFLLPDIGKILTSRYFSQTFNKNYKVSPSNWSQAGKCGLTEKRLTEGHDISYLLTYLIHGAESFLSS